MKIAVGHPDLFVGNPDVDLCLKALTEYPIPGDDDVHWVVPQYGFQLGEHDTLDAVMRLVGPEPRIGPDGYVTPNTRHLATVMAESVGVHLPREVCRPTLKLHDRDVHVRDAWTRAATKPIVTIQSQTLSPVKSPGPTFWGNVVEALKEDFDLVHVWDPNPRLLPGVRFVQCSQLRGSISAIAAARVHLTIDSWTYHAASALGIPCVLLLGGFADARAVAYDFSDVVLPSSWPPPPCWPCWSESGCLTEKYCYVQMSVTEVVEKVRTKAKVVQ